MSLRRFRPDEGAQALEFALVAPAALFLFMGIMYALLALSANVSLAHAASAAVRYAAIPTDNIEPVYPTVAQVESRLFSQTPFFSADACAVSFSGAAVPNAPISLSVTCPFTNPLGSTLDGLRALLAEEEVNPLGNSFTFNATATGRRE